MADPSNAGEPRIWLIGERCMILVREWKHGDQAGLTAEQVYVRIDEYEDMAELTGNMTWPETTSESLAEGLATGKLQRIVLPSSPPHSSD